jgi:hypothetical protein
MPISSAHVSGTHFDPSHILFAPPLRNGEPSQTELTTELHQRTSAASTVASNQGMKMSQAAKTACIICVKEFHAKKALLRHMDDRHSKPKKCHHANCNYKCIGKRKLQHHLHKIHGVEPSRRRATHTRKVVTAESKSYPSMWHLPENHHMSRPIFTSTFSVRSLHLQ